MTQRTTTIYRRSSRPWSNAFPETKANSIAVKYGFPDEFDLADKLSEATWRYLGRSRLTGREDAIIHDELTNARDSKSVTSMRVAILIQLWRNANPRLVRSASVGSSIAATLRSIRNAKKSPGAIPDLARQSFFRTLGAIYEDGTGKKPWIQGTWLSRPRGTPYRFICDVCSELQLNVTVAFMKEVHYRHQKVFK